MKIQKTFSKISGYIVSYSFRFNNTFYHNFIYLFLFVFTLRLNNFVFLDLYLF
ncbi:hypothetical protein CLOSTASPAR_02198 [[Clostridium] asparagiforme DSM 15981]|uniref:Uncharacterized protein n=1 Tax=[Clostridium] asparagiforme DSM 15981 TaxID=518636 RepID=C0CYX1_9FIRM|nr:hypothetical protein CLOSTASPAR_02198 [[Clostridium] asparagiforme DSM 15981]